MRSLPNPYPKSNFHYRIPFLIGSLVICLAGYAQEYNYTHYTIKDGLASSTVYCIAQDKEGFMWFATETGVSRFDGTQFKNFTSKDGLPDNTIINIFSDSRGRVWMIPFKSSICYYYNGKIYNQQNDSTLKKIQLTEIVGSIVENKSADIILKDRSCLYQITSQNEVKRISWNEVCSAVTKMSIGDSGYFYILCSDTAYKYDTRKFQFQKKFRSLYAGSELAILHDRFFCWMESLYTLHVQSSLYGLDFTYKVPPVNSLYRINDSTICINTTNGTLILNILQRAIIHHFLPSKNVSRNYTDSEGSTWFSTFNDGIYRLNSEKIRNIKNTVTPDKHLTVFDLQKNGPTLLVGSDKGYLEANLDNASQPVSLYRNRNMPLHHPVISLKQRGNMLAISSVQQIFLKTAASKIHASGSVSAIKEIDFKNDQELVAATASGLYLLSIPDLQSQCTIWVGRTTTLLCRNDSVYFGTLHGLYLLKPDKSVFYFGDSSTALRNRISAIKEGSDGIIWVATDDGGILGMKNNRIIWHFTQDNGLSSNICRSIATDNNSIWVGTDKGLNKVDLTTGRPTVSHYTTADGLSSDMINTILLDGNTIYAGTPDGISYFDKNLAPASAPCFLKLNGININGVDASNKEVLTLEYGNNNIKLAYIGISYRANGNILYSYRLTGLDTTWKTTTQTSLEFISLPPGEYNLEVFALNKFKVKSNTITVKLIINAPYWQTSWFILLIAGIIIFITWLVITKRNKIIRKKEIAERIVEQRLQELEQKALRAQMNPHFIFNSLSSVQTFILDNDADSANQYLNNFARLIRQTLDNSFKSVISVAHEINYLSTYLSLEQMRTTDRFQYALQVDDKIVTTDTFIPAMILQPFVENAIRHGIQNKEIADGRIEISFSQNDQLINCTIIDNGVGRRNAQVLKTAQHIEYQSRGIQLTQERIEIMNMNLETPIVVDITDVTDAVGNVAGTKVDIQFPLIRNEEKKPTL